MRLHTSNLTPADVTQALRDMKASGKIDRDVDFETFEHRGSRSRTSAYELQLGWYGEKVPGDGRRYKNAGKSGADNVYAATYDEWGWFISRLFQMDPDASFGHYKTEAGFHEYTKGEYRMIPR